MPLESCMILLDCSEYMRNGDYIPTRLAAQQDAANMLVGVKTQSNPESTVGVSVGTELLVSPTTDVGKVMRAIRNGSKYRSSTSTTTITAASAAASNQTTDDVCAAVQIASLALKHRLMKTGAQRIILFVGSPLDAVETKALQKTGRLLKKNNVAIDVVAMGELEQNETKLQELVEAANGRTEDAARTCHLVTIPAGVLPSDVLANSPILASDGGPYAAAVGAVAASGFGSHGDGGAGAFADFGGVDPNMDPELAMALRVSMEEERARQERAAAAAAAALAQENNAEGGAATGGGGGNTSMELEMSEEDALLQQALELSMQQNNPPPKSETNDANIKIEEDDTKPAAMDTEQDPDAAMQVALQMSMQQQEQEAAAKPSSEFQDPAFVSQLLGSMPGVDPNDPQIQEALRKAAAKKPKKEEDDEAK